MTKNNVAEANALIVKVIMNGTRPLLMHNGRIASQMDSYNIASKEYTSKRKKTEEDYFQIYKLQFESSLYFDPYLEAYSENNYNKGLGPVIPGYNIFKSIQAGAKLNKLGKQVERGVIFNDMYCPVEYEGPRDLKRLWGDGKSAFVDIRQVGSSNGRFDICRPIFHDWSVTATYTIDTDMLDFNQFELIVRNTGLYIGIGAFRQMYGRFSYEIETISDKELVA